MTVHVTREQVLAYRVAAHGLARVHDNPGDLDVLDLGVQDSPAGSARQALAARLHPSVDPGATGDGSLELTWSVRGAPHLHRHDDLPRLAAALWPHGEGDALARLPAVGERIAAAGVPVLTAIDEAVRAWRAAVTGPATKGEASAAVTERVPAALSAWCEGCGARHVFDQLFRLTALPAGIRIVSPRAPVTFAPIPDWPDIAPDRAAAAEVVTACLGLLGPANRADVAAFLGTRPGQIAAVWPDGLAEVRVDGRRAWLPEVRVPALRVAEPLDIVRLLPPSDPYLQARDRELVLPDKASRAALWRGLLGRTGAVLVGAEVTGVWRARASGNRLVVTVAAFTPWPSATRDRVEAEADRLAAVRGMRSVEVRDESAGSPA